MLTATEIATFRRTALTAYHGALMLYRITRFEIARTHRYLTSQEAIAVYQFTWHCLKIAMALAIVAGMSARDLCEYVREWVDRTVSESIAPEGVAVGSFGEPEATDAKGIGIASAPNSSEFKSLTVEDLRKLCADAGIKFRWYEGKSRKYLSKDQMILALGG